MRVSSLALVLALVGPAHAENWATAAGDDPEFKASRAICKKAEAVALPKPAPGAAPPADCDAQALYDGVKGEADPVAARRCALVAWSAPGAVHDNPLESAGVLAMIYANGKGVPRDLDVAIHYACELDGAPAEMDARIKALAAMKAKGPGAKPFDICDDATSGAMEGYCAERTSAIAAARRATEMAALTKDFDASRKAAFDKLAAADAAFVEALVDNEVDTSGTGRGAFIVEARDRHEAAFQATLKAALAGKLPDASSDAFTKSDKALNSAYGRVMALKDTSGLGSVEKKGIKATQRTWLTYRDSFAAFVKGTPTTPDTIRTTLTEQRTKDLEGFLN